MSSRLAAGARGRLTFVVILWESSLRPSPLPRSRSCSSSARSVGAHGSMSRTAGDKKRRAQTRRRFFSSSTDPYVSPSRPARH